MAVIGAGGSGVLAALALRRAGVDFELLEARDGIGGTWRFDPDGDGSACYASLVANTSKLRMSAAGRPIPGRPWQYAGHREMLAYLERIADEEDLRRSIRLGWRVTEARPEPDGGWSLTSSTGDTGTYRAVVCALGTNGRPRRADIAGDFDGEQMHSAAYRTPNRFAGRDVLVIGLGTSGMEVAGELAGTARSVHVAVRDPMWIMTRRLGRFPIDWLDDPITSRLVPWPLRRHVLKLLSVLSVGRLRRHGLPWPTRRIGDDILSVSDTFPRAVRAGLVQFHPAVERAEGRTVTFADGSSAEVDAIVHATDFDPPLEFLPASAQPARTGLYRAIVHPALDDLYFVGLCEATHALLPIAGEQAEWAAAALSGRIEVPPAAERRRVAAKEAARRRRDFGDRRPFMLDWATYIARLKRERRASRRGRSANAAPSAAAKKSAA